MHCHTQNRFVPVVDAINESRVRMLDNLAKRVQVEKQMVEQDLPKWPRKESYMRAKALQVRGWCA